MIGGQQRTVKSLEFVFKYTRKYKVPLAATVASMLLLVGIQLLASSAAVSVWLHRLYREANA